MTLAVVCEAYTLGSLGVSACVLAATLRPRRLRLRQPGVLRAITLGWRP